MYEDFYGPNERRLADKSSPGMELASLFLGAVAIMSCTCLYLSLPCGALAVILGVLSRGGQMQYGPRAQTGITLGCIALLTTLLIYGIAIAVLLQRYGSIEGILQASSELAGMDYEELMRELYPGITP